MLRLSLFKGGARTSTVGLARRSLSVLPQNTSEDRLLVIGSGVAGSAAALIAAQIHQIPVTLLYAGQQPTDCNSYWAQGGIIYRGPRGVDSADLLSEDIHRAGAGLCYDPAVQKVSHEGPSRVEQLLLDETDVFAKVPFSTDEVTGQLALCLEASHQAPRILFKADHTGKAITEHITQAAQKHPLIEHVPYTVVTDLLLQDGVCVGVEALDRLTHEVKPLTAHRGTVLASGGLAGIYEHSTNPSGFNALGSSVALAARAGATTQDLEYVQFHPTALCIPNESRFLLTEALRGEGAILMDANGRAFAKDYHKDGELAPRDIVARAVFSESRKDEDRHNAFLDISHRDGDWLHQRFPTIQAHLTHRGLDLANDPLPVIPAAHYTCGGVTTDLQGRTSIPNLYAAGEAARTGLHGGNRLASTSLLEALVFGASVADFLGSEEGREMGALAGALATDRRLADSQRRMTADSSKRQMTVERASRLLKNLKSCMWENVGVVRTPAGLEVALHELADMQFEAHHLHESCPTIETAAVRDATVAGYQVATAAYSNRNSTGAHCIVDDTEDSDSDEEEALAAAWAAARY